VIQVNKRDFEDFEDFNKFEGAVDIISPYEFDKPVSAGAARVKAIAVASTGFVILGALVSGGAFAMTGTLPNVLPSAPAVVTVDPSPAPTDTTVATDTASPTSTDTATATATDTAAPSDTSTAAPTDTSVPVATPSLPVMTDDDEADDQDDNADDQGFDDEGSDD